MSAALSTTISSNDDAAEAPVRPGRTVRTNLAWLTIALVVPILLFGAALLWRFAESERERLEGEGAYLAKTVANMVDRDITGIFASLDVLSTSAYLRAGDFEGFRGQAVELQQRQGIVTVLSRMDGQQLVNVRVPDGTPLPKTALRWDEAMIASGRPFVTNFLIGSVTGNKQVLAAMPIRQDGTLAYMLYLSVPLVRLQKLLADAEIPATYTTSIVDRNGTILARSARADEFVGKAASADLRANTTGAAGTWSGTTVDGISIFGSYARSNLTGFVAATGIRYADLNAPIWRSLVLFATTGVAMVILSVLLAIYFGQRITAPIGALAREAARLGRGDPVEPLATGLAEADRVGAVLAGASANLRERETDLREANDEIQRFAYIVSHDLRSPLVNIMGFTTELEALRGDIFERIDALKARIGPEDGTPDEALGRDFDEAVGFIKTSIAKMDRLINAILQLSRQGRREFNPERIDMNELVSNIAASLAIQADAAGAIVSSQPLPGIVGDRLALEQIFSNLVDNALKYLRRGVPGEVEVTGHLRGRMAVYEVRDNGRGIEARDLDRVFDLFRRSGVQDRPGEGIGLAHVRALVRRLGGTISVTSEPGDGSTFTVTLPRRWAGERQRKAA